MANDWPRTPTMSADMMASVSGILMRKLEPRPSVELTSMVPPIFSTLRRTTSMPTPRPDTAVTCSAVENPAWKMKSNTRWSGISATASAVHQAPFHGLGPDALHVQTLSRRRGSR